MNSNINYYTAEGLENLKQELHRLTTVERPSISQQIAEARDKGDLSENAEYHAAKEAQGLLELKIAKLQETIRNARVIDTSKLDNSKVMMLAQVTIKNMANNKTMTYHLVPENEADLKQGKLSVNSPIAQALMGKTLGEIVEVNAPAGKIKFEILEIKR